jgi:hypothetical protein
VSARERARDFIAENIDWNADAATELEQLAEALLAFQERIEKVADGVVPASYSARVSRAAASLAVARRALADVSNDIRASADEDDS